MCARRIMQSTHHKPIPASTRLEYLRNFQYAVIFICNENNFCCLPALPPPLQMSVLSRQVTAVSQELQEMTRLLRPLCHSPSALLVPSAAVTPPPSVSSLSCSPAPPHAASRHTPANCPDDQNHDDRTPEPAEHHQCFVNNATETNPPLSSHWSAPSSLNCVSFAPPLPASPSPSSSSHPTSPTLSIVVSGTGSEPQTQFHPRPGPHSLSRSAGQIHQEPMCCTPRHCLSQSLTPPPGEVLLSRNPPLDLEAQDLGEGATAAAELSFIDEGRSSV